MDGSAWDTFQPFGRFHAGVLAVFGFMMIGLIAARRRLDARGQARTLDRALAAIGIAVAILTNGYWLLPSNFSKEHSWPLHLCDLGSIIAPIAIITARRRWRALLYYWGIGLSAWGFLTPDLKDGPGRIGFWLFWATHASVVGSALYDLIARRFRPGWAEWRIASAGGLLYVLLILPINLIFGFNYGYLGRALPGQPTIIDALGPWPGRVFILPAGVLLLFVGMTLPWVIHRSPGTRMPLLPREDL